MNLKSKIGKAVICTGLTIASLVGCATSQIPGPYTRVENYKNLPNGYTASKEIDKKTNLSPADKLIYLANIAENMSVPIEKGKYGNIYRTPSIEDKTIHSNSDKMKEILEALDKNKDKHIDENEVWFQFNYVMRMPHNERLFKKV